MRKTPKCLSPKELLDNPATAVEMCAEAKQAATFAIAGAFTGLAAASIAAAPVAAPESEDFVDAPTLARRLNVKVSWVRTEERAGRLPSVHVGRYVKFRSSEVLAALTVRKAG
jgi:hypothetical protein